MTRKSPDLHLGVIGNCSFGALIDRQARIVWSCMPRFDGDPVFSALLDDKDMASAAVRGIFDVSVENYAGSAQDYLPNTAVLRTEMHDAEGNAVEVVDFAPRFNQFGRRYRPASIIRIVRPIRGTPRIRIRARPTFDYGSITPALTSGSNHIRFVGPNLALRLTASAPISYILGETWFRLERPISMVIGPDETLLKPVTAFCTDCFNETVSYWREWVRMLAIPLDWQDAVIRAAIGLKLCWFEDTGAFVAAMTTSIPEAPDSTRNWDYRYCWLRDSYYVIRALNRLGVVDIMEGYLAYLRNVMSNAGPRPLQPVYDISLETGLDERTADALAGYRGMGPVRIGNQAYIQRQNDVYGQVVLSSAQAFFDRRLLRPVGLAAFHQLEEMGERAYALHEAPDSGLWEFRTTTRIHTYSSTMCWAACNRLGRIAQHLGLGGRSRFWRQRATEIRDKILARAWNDDAGYLAASFGGTEIDASLLQLVDVGLISPKDPRFRRTLAIIESRLVKNHHVMRYADPDDFGYPQTAFNFCSFWYIEALHAAGQKALARRTFEAMLAARNHVGLLSEDIDIASGEMWGNYPQTYSLVGIINSAMLLTRPWRAAR
ncbi:MAG: glycoside hydrolase family 15 protein [Dongiaceae bacterium]